MTSWRLGVSRFWLIGTSVSVLIPTLVWAVDIPHSFQSGQAISAVQMNENFASLSSEIDTLHQKLATVEATVNAVQAQVVTARAVAPPQVFDELDADGEHAVFEVLSDGIFVADPDNSGWEQVRMYIYPGDARGGTQSDNVDVRCGGSACLSIQVLHGQTSHLLVSKGMFVGVRGLEESTGALTGNVVKLAFQSLDGPSGMMPQRVATLNLEPRN